MSTQFELVSPRGKSLRGTITSAAGSGKRPVVLICHGFKGFQEWCFLPYLAELLAARGYTAVRFNLSGSGMRPGDELVTDLDAFRRSTFSEDLEEVLFVLAQLPTLDEERIDGNRIGLFGHSRGGGASILAAAESEVSALVTWAAVSTFDRASVEEKHQWREQGVFPIRNSRTGQELPLGVELLDDAEENAHRLDIRTAAKSLSSPWLIVHGADDETVPVDEGQLLRDRSRAETEYCEIARAGHTFGAVHPFSGPTPQLIQAMNATQTWFRRYLG